MKTYIIIWSLLMGLTAMGWAQANPEFGKASVYDDTFDGHITASGIPYDKDSYTAAHKSLPFGSVVRITRLDNNMSINVTINDRGSFVAGQITDLSAAAASAIRIGKDEEVNVKLSILKMGEDGSKNTAITKVQPPSKDAKPESKAVKPPSKTSTTTASPANSSTTTPSTPSKNKGSATAKSSPADATAKTTATKRPTSSATNTATVKLPSELDKKSRDAQVSTYNRTAPVRTVVETPGAKDAPSEFPLLQSKNYSEYGLYKVKVMKPSNEGYGVQVAYLTSHKNVLKQVAKLQDHWFENILVSVEKEPLNQVAYKIILGPFPDQATAHSYEQSLKRKHGIKGFVIDLSTIEY